MSDNICTVAIKMKSSVPKMYNFCIQCWYLYVLNKTVRFNTYRLDNY